MSRGLQRIGINGFGRIGRAVLRVISRRDDMQVVATNDLFSAETLAYLFKYDTVMGVFEGDVSHADGALLIDSETIRLTAERDPALLAWSDAAVDTVIEATGVFRRRADLEKHLEAGAERVILTVPSKDEIDAIVVLGVNDDALRPEHRLLSNASCTTNCLAPLVKVLDDAFGLDHGVMTTVHAYTNDQRLADVPHRDFRRSRAATQNLIPTTTGAARAVAKVLPHLEGKLDGRAIRVPVPDGSVVDLVCKLSGTPSVEELNRTVGDAASGAMSRILEYTEEAIVSSDIIGNPHSSIVDGLATRRIGQNEYRVLSWYDNEWGYSNRVVDLAARVADRAG